MLGGGFTTANGTSAVVAHLNADGSFGAIPQTEANGLVWALAIQPDGKVLMGGDFTFVDGVPRSFLARVNAGGDLDASFGQSLSINGSLRSVKVLDNGQILIGGNFTSVNGVARNRIARLHGDGSLDPSFNPGRGADSWVSTLAVQPDGRVLLGGSFLSVDGVRRSRIARLNGNGTLDSTFDPGLGLNEAVTSIAIQADGKVIAAGGFSAADGLLPDGSSAFTAMVRSIRSSNSTQAANDWIESLAIQPDGGLLIAGNFTSTNQSLRTRIARLQGGDPASSPPAIAAAPLTTTINAGSELVLRASARSLPQPTTVVPQ